MTDLLTHVLIAFAVGRLVAKYHDGMTRSHVTSIMVGAVIPEMTKYSLLFPDHEMTAFLGTQFTSNPLASVYGVVLSVLIGTVLVIPKEQQRVFLTLSLGAVTHLVLDAVVLKPAPTVELFLWPLPELTVRLPIVHLYRSTDWWLPIVGGVIALIAWYHTKQ